LAELRRAFVAVVPPPAVRAWAGTAADVAAAVAPDLRWSRLEQRHLTLRFFGPVPDADALAELVAAVVRRRQPFSLSLGGGGAFPNATRASVLWLGVRDGTDALPGLAETLGPLDRPYRPHLTLARAPKARDLSAAVAALDACGDSDAWPVHEIVLFESDGSRHTEQARFRLAG
jgi:RNA 2',3'-cyclic 3'-phosphodiesterase